ncbi:hypothetical protein FUAX_49380 (plasmid) [Fulvitalea axinellae]|uniref:Signal transduction histidine kinase internal region domain-containing protein n=1 Tax=Fulvitalea axinellae TaxID=1182444 RepID=A0AAU9DHC4_9BACT|nr:hypothetical protein FUAX_49380 [Fulvitalea axinellae]
MRFHFGVGSYIYEFFKYQITERTQNYAEKEAELRLLKSKTNPHFLFNALNSLYSFALKENADYTAENILKLADMIRFMQKDIEKDKIPLARELKYINDYISIQQTRCSKKPTVKLKLSGIGKVEIAPLMLVPFVENAFKHGISLDTESSLEIRVECEENTMRFFCGNTVTHGQYRQNTFQRGFGIGINNVRQRLALVYPHNHRLDIDDREDYFSVNLELYDTNRNN